MLDLYIIDRIRQERERAKREGNRIPLRIERPEPPPPTAQTEEEEEQKRGAIVIDFLA
jgi:hypothetical protein